MKRKVSDRSSDITIKKNCEQRPGPSASSSVESRKSVPEVDFINDAELLKAVQIGVLKTSDDVIEQFKKDGVMEFDPEVLSRVGALLWDTLVGDWTSDLLGFSAHANRIAVNADDVSLVMRRNEGLLKIVSEIAGFSETEGVVKKQRSIGRKRKTQAAVVPIACSTPLKEGVTNVSTSQNSLLQITPIPLTSQIPVKIQSIVQLDGGKENDSFEDEPMFMENLPISKFRSGVDTSTSYSTILCVPNSKDSNGRQIPTTEDSTFSINENLTAEKGSLLTIEKFDVKSSHASSAVTKQPHYGDSFDDVFSFDQTLKIRHGSKQDLDSEEPLGKPHSPDIFDTPVKVPISSAHNDSFEDSVAVVSSDGKRNQTVKTDEKRSNLAKTKGSEWSTKFAAFSFVDSIGSDENGGKLPLVNKKDVKTPTMRTPKISDKKSLPKSSSIKSSDSRKVKSSSSRIGDLISSFDDDDIDFSQLD